MIPKCLLLYNPPKAFGKTRERGEKRGEEREERRREREREERRRVRREGTCPDVLRTNTVSAHTLYD